MTLKTSSWLDQICFGTHLDQLIPLLHGFLDQSVGRPFAEELHESALHDEPQTSRQVEDHRQEDEVDRDPLVVGIVDGALDVILIR